MKRFVFAILTIVSLIIAFGGVVFASPGEQDNPVPTLISPTAIPRQPVVDEIALPSQSTLARIQNNGLLRVGILYNAPPFGELDLRGEHSGYDADLARSIAEAWGVNVEFVQITRQSEDSTSMLRTGEVDMLMGAQVHRRELDSLVEFSQTYYMGQRSIIVRTDDQAMTPLDMNNRSLGVVVATPVEDAVNNWIARNRLSVPVQTYLTLDRAYVALVAGEIDGVVDSDYRLYQVSALRPELTQILDEPIEQEPFAIAIMRQDVAMRDLVNRTLQHLTENGRMEEIHRAYFPGERYDVIIAWDNLGEDAPKPEQFSNDFILPQQNIISRIQTERVIRVAGLFDAAADAPLSQQALDTLHRALLQQMVARWGMPVQFVPNSAGNALELVANGQADIAVGITPDWNWANRVDFTGAYVLHGQRLMIRVNDPFENFSDLPGKTIIFPNNESGASERILDLASSVNVRVEMSGQREQDLAFVLLTDTDILADVAFGDSLKLIPHVRENPTSLILTERPNNPSGPWYSKSLMVMAVPENDIDFRLLVDYTLQEMIRDGTVNSLLPPLMLQEDIPAFEIWPGNGNYSGFSISAP